MARHRLANEFSAQFILGCGGRGRAPIKSPGGCDSRDSTHLGVAHMTALPPLACKCCTSQKFGAASQPANMPPPPRHAILHVHHVICQHHHLLPINTAAWARRPHRCGLCDFLATCEKHLHQSMLNKAPKRLSMLCGSPAKQTSRAQDSHSTPLSTPKHPPEGHSSWIPSRFVHLLLLTSQQQLYRHSCCKHTPATAALNTNSKGAIEPGCTLQSPLGALLLVSRAFLNAPRHAQPVFTRRQNSCRTQAPAHRRLSCKGERKASSTLNRMLAHTPPQGDRFVRNCT